MVMCYMFYEHIIEENRQRSTKYDRLENEERTVEDAVKSMDGKTVYQKLWSFVLFFAVVLIGTTIYICLMEFYVNWLINERKANYEKHRKFRTNDSMISIQ